MRRRSRRSARRSTTSRRTSKTGATKLARLIAELPPERATAAFTHSSWVAERSESYERLEFLGDSVLELAIAHTLYERFPASDEGRLAKLRSHIVSRASCAVVSRELRLGERLVARHPGAGSEDPTRLSENPNVLAALLEAALAALYLEHGYERIAPAIVEAFEERIHFTLTNQVDHKTELQEALAQTGRTVTYVLLATEGLAHERTFTVGATVAGVQLGTGRGSSKKAAEQEAAEQVLAALSAASGDTAVRTWAT